MQRDTKLKERVLNMWSPVNEEITHQYICSCTKIIELMNLDKIYTIRNVNRKTKWKNCAEFTGGGRNILLYRIN